MRSPRNLLLVLLTLATAGTGLLAWRQYGELVELRAQVMNREERADLQKRLWDLEKANRDLRTQAASANSSRPDGDGPSPGAPGEGRGRGGREGNPMAQMNTIRELMNRPDVQAFMNSQQRAGVDRTYAALFRKLNLPSAQADKVRALLTDRQTTALDVMEAARSQGIDPRQNPDAYRKLLTDARAEVESGLKAVLGDSGYSQLQSYEQTLPQRTLVGELQQRLSASETPLSLSQAEQLVQVLSANAPARPATAPTTTVANPAAQLPVEPGRGFRGPEIGGMMATFLGAGGPIPASGPGGIMAVLGGPVSAAPITGQAVAQAQAILSQPQVDALQQMQQQQQAQQQMQQILRETFQSNAPGRTPAADGSTSSPARRPGG